MKLPRETMLHPGLLPEMTMLMQQHRLRRLMEKSHDCLNQPSLTWHAQAVGLRRVLFFSTIDSLEKEKKGR